MSDAGEDAPEGEPETFITGDAEQQETEEEKKAREDEEAK